MSWLALQARCSAPELLNYSQGPSASFGPPLGKSREGRRVWVCVCVYLGFVCDSRDDVTTGGAQGM